MTLVTLDPTITPRSTTRPGTTMTSTPTTGRQPRRHCLEFWHRSLLRS
jgi:hypothetical protein